MIVARFVCLSPRTEAVPSFGLTKRRNDTSSLGKSLREQPSKTLYNAAVKGNALRATVWTPDMMNNGCTMCTYTDAEGPCVEFTKPLLDILVVAGNAYRVIGPEGELVRRPDRPFAGCHRGQLSYCRRTREVTGSLGEPLQ